MAHPAEDKARELDAPDEAKRNGMVYQVWEDGEITLQKSGEILWQRSLHCIIPAVSDPVTGLKFPHDHGPHSYAWMRSREDAMTVRALVSQGAHEPTRVETAMLGFLDTIERK